MPRRDEPEIDIRAIVLLLVVLGLPAAIPDSVRSSHSSHSLFSAAGLLANPIIFLPLAMAGLMFALWYFHGRRNRPRIKGRTGNAIAKTKKTITGK